MSRSILYYPSMDIKDGIWLRNAILYWDHIHSIVPDTYEPEYSPEIKELLDRGIYTPIYPAMLFYSDGNNEFEKEIKNKMERFNPTLRKANLKYIEQMYFPQMAMMIHYKKLPTEVYDLMMSWGLLKVNDDEWVEMEVNAANIYMSTLAEHIAEVCSEDIIVGTDRNSYLYDTFERQWKSSNKMCLTTIFEKALPTPNLDVSYETLLDFRDSREMELLYLRNEIRNFEERLSKCESYCELKKVTNAFKEKWEKEIMSMDKLLKDHKIGYRLGNMKSLITMAGSAMGLMNSIENVLGNIPTWMMGTSIMSSGAIGIGTNFINHRARLNEKRNSGSFAYLYDGVHNGILRRGNFSEMI